MRKVNLSPIGIALIGYLSVSCAASGNRDGYNRMDPLFFNGVDLAGWTEIDEYWSVEEGVIVGRATEEVLRNKFLFSSVEVENFYLSVWVKLTPDDRNSGIQFRSQKDFEAHAVGYQADIGRGWWGKLYHELGRGRLDWHDAGESHIRPEEWNHYEILAVDHRIWAAINGHISVALRDPEGELSGYIAFQIHSGPPQEVRFRAPELIHDPPVRLAGLNESELDAVLRSPEGAKR
jgi:hypothetical protein